MAAKVLMVQGTASSCGKSTLVAALCRIFRQDGLRVAPFKSQNMALNSFVTRDGGEMGRAQVVQAQAAGIEPSVDMNPILLKPEADHRSQVVLMGRPVASYVAGEYYRLKPKLWPVVTEALARLREQYDVVVIEGAGSPAEINLKEGDIVNMRVARYAEAPVLLVGDIDRGGVFAHLVGTLALLEPDERALVRAMVINKFRGDIELLRPGLHMLEERTAIPVAGVIPYFRDIHLAEEDSVALEEYRQRQPAGLLDIAVVRLPRISNFDDFDPLAREPGVGLRYVTSVAELGQPDLVILPGTKSTIADLTYLRESGLAAAIIRLAGDGTPVIGICGGYQMLGLRLCDPDHVESDVAEAEGLGLLPVVTHFARQKATHQVRGAVAADCGLFAGAAGEPVAGYEIHMGRTHSSAAPALHLEERSGYACDDTDGALDERGLVLGTYMHGLFHNDGLRRRLLNNLARCKGVALPLSPGLDADAEYDKLAALVRSSLDMALIYRIAGLRT